MRVVWGLLGWVIGGAGATQSYAWESPAIVKAAKEKPPVPVRVPRAIEYRTTRLLSLDDGAGFDTRSLRRALSFVGECVPVATERAL